MTLTPLILQWVDSFHPFTLFLLFIPTFLFLVRASRGSSEKLNLPPSPLKLPIIGNLHQLGTLLHHSLRKLSDKHGPLMLLHLGYAPTLIVSSAEMVKEIAKNHDIAFSNRPLTTAAKLCLYEVKDLAFAPHGEYWRQIRKIFVTELLSMKRVESFKFVREEETAIMINKISQSCSTGASINLSEMIVALSNNVVSRCALGAKPEGKEGKLPRELMKLFGSPSIGDLFPWLGWIDVLTGLIARLKKVFKELDKFFDQIIDEHINQSKPDDRKDFVDILLEVQKNSALNFDFNRDNIKAIILDVFVGASDSTSTAIEWIMAELVKNPQVMKKAQDEVRTVAAKKSKVDKEDINQMDYLKCVIKESLRLHPPLALLAPRESSTATKINNYHIPPNTRLLFNAWAFHRDPELWDRAEEFIPERFINNPIDFKGQDYEFIPFGSGRRGCPGMSFGVASVEFAIANLLYWFNWELPGNAKKEELDMNEAFGLAVYKKNPLQLLPISHFS